MAKKKKNADAWGDVLTEGGRVDVVEQMPSSFWSKFLTKYIYVAMVGLPIIVLLAVSQLSGLDSRLEGVESKVNSAKVQASTPGRAVATQVVERWLTQDVSPLPGAFILSWDGATEVPVTQQFDEQKQDVTEPTLFKSEINRFTLADNRGRLYNVAVQVRVDPRGGAIATSGPSILATDPVANDGWENGSPWPGVKEDSSSATEAVTTAIQSWAEAYTSGDPKKLTLAVRDPNADHLYLPLNGVEKVETKVVSAANKVFEKNDIIFVQFTMEMLWEGQKLDPEKANDVVVPTTMDALVVGADTASPTVVAWGAPGSAPTLEPYSNSISARAIDSTEPLPNESESPSAEPVPTESESPSAEPTDTETP